MIVIFFDLEIGNIKNAKEILAEETDTELREMAKMEISELEEKKPEMEEEIKVLLIPKDPEDDKNAIVELRAGTGGDEACIFVEDCFRMYSMFFKTMGWKSEVLNSSEGTTKGYKEISISVEGDGIYGMLKFESGVHRVQRVPETESQGRVHTSAITVAVLPEAEDVDFELNMSDVRRDTYRASGAGGQHVNRTDSAVRITHEPTGIVVQCQNDRSQHKNKDQAMKQLKAKLYEFELQKQNAEKQAMEDSKSDIGWGSQIRSYVLDDSRIKDLRTGVETRNTQAVLDGDLDKFIEASLKSGL